MPVPRVDLYCVIHVCFSILLIFLLDIVSVFFGFFISRDSQEEITSPSGNTTIVLVYDSVARPSIY